MRGEQNPCGFVQDVKQNKWCLKRPKMEGTLLISSASVHKCSCSNCLQIHVHIFLKTNSKVYFVMHALHFLLLQELFNQCSCQTHLSPNLVISVRLPIVSGISGISLCWRSSDVIWTQFPISAHSKDIVSKEVRLLSNKLAGTVLSAYQQYISAPFDLHFSMLSCTITIFSWLTSQ